jgi:hypothetical protein
MSSAVAKTSEIAPVVVDLGKKKKKDIRDLKRGEGKLMEDVHKVIEQIRANSSELVGKELVPVVILYRKEPKRKVAGLLPFGLGG